MVPTQEKACAPFSILSRISPGTDTSLRHCINRQADSISVLQNASNPKVLLWLNPVLRESPCFVEVLAYVATLIKACGVNRISMTCIIHEHFLLQSPIRCYDKPSAGGLAPPSLDVLHEYASGPHGSARRSRDAAQRFRDEPA